MSPTAALSAPFPEQIAELCLAARDYIQRALGCTIELSEESLAFVDHYISQVREGSPAPPGAELTLLLATALGAHLGEVLRAKFGGVWEGAEAPTYQVKLAAAPLSFYPVAMAAEALHGAEVPGYPSVLITTERRELLPSLLEALSQAPVTEEYYYSLTGRLETVGYAVELLMELLRAKDAPDPLEM